MSEVKKLMFNKNPLLILSYLSKNILNNNISSHISKELSLGLGSVHSILKDFESIGLLRSKRLGKSVLYEVKDDPIIKAFRVFDNMLELQPLIETLKQYSRKIILFGSCARGEDKQQSDIDLIVIADESEKDIIMNKISEFEIDREIKPIIIDMIEFMEMESNDAVFYIEIIKGIELWEASNE